MGTGNKETRPLRVLLLIEKGQEHESLERMVMASGQVAQTQMRYCCETEKEAYDACRNYAPDLVIYQGQTQKGLKKITTDFHMKVLVLEAEVKPPLFSSTGSVAEFRRQRKSNLLLLYEAVDPNHFFWQNVPRNLSVSSPPHEYVDFLMGKGINVFVFQNREPWQVRDILNRSKISLNFDRDQFKITTCGAMMLDAGTEAGEFFRSPQEMAVFQSKEELLDLIRFYLKNFNQREEIAQEGRNKSEIWSVWNCWGHAFERMGFPVPDFLEKAKSYRLHRRLMKGIEDEGSVCD